MFLRAGAKRLLSVLLLLCFALGVVGQKVQDVKIDKVEITPQKTCRADGKLVVTIKNPSGKQVNYQLKKTDGTVIVQNNADGIFTGVAAGDYRVSVVNALNHGQEYDARAVTVPNAYKSMDASKVKITTEGLCGSFKPGGTIKIDVSSIVGGTKPYQYSIIKSENPGYDDHESKYSNKTQLAVNEFGKYQVRIKDACNDYITITHDLQPNLATVMVKNYPINNQPCGTNSAELFNIGLYDAKTGGRINFESYTKAGGVKLQIRDKNASGKVLFDKIITHGNHKEIQGNKDFVFKLSPTNEYWAKVTTPCGGEWEGVLQNSTRIRFDIRAATAGCAGDKEEGMVFQMPYYIFSRFPVTMRFVNMSKSPEKVEQTIRLNSRDDQQFETKVLPYGKYRVEMKTECGSAYDPAPVIVENIKGAGAVKAGRLDLDLDMCDGNGHHTKETGTTGVTLTIDGFFHNQRDALVRIIKGPSNVGVTSFIWKYRHRWYNMKQGHYTAEVFSCGKRYEIEFDVNYEKNKFLEQEIESKAVSKCSGGGSITSKINYNGSFSTLVELLDEHGNPVLDASGQARTSTSGSFSNLAPGTYNTRIRVNPWCTVGDEKYYYIYNRYPLVITNSTSGPQIKSYIGVACEDLHGQLAKGSIYLLLSATEDAELKYRKKGTTTWTKVDYESNAKIEGLDVATYEVQLTSCGQNVVKEVKISPISPSLKDQIKHPCLGNAYRLSLPFYSGATYEWSRNGRVLSNGTAVDFANFREEDNGEYVCKLQWGSCVTRIVKFWLNAHLCGEDVGEKTIKGTVFDDRNGLTNGMIDGTPISKAGDKQLYVQVMGFKNGAYQHMGTSTPVAADGTFSIGGLLPNSYRLILTTQQGNVISSTPIPGWRFVGESAPATGIDAHPDGVLEVTITTADIADLRFGIKRATKLRTNRHITTKL